MAFSTEPEDTATMLDQVAAGIPTDACFSVAVVREDASSEVVMAMC